MCGWTLGWAWASRYACILAHSRAQLFFVHVCILVGKNDVEFARAFKISSSRQDWAKGQNLLILNLSFLHAFLKFMFFVMNIYLFLSILIFVLILILHFNAAILMQFLPLFTAYASRIVSATGVTCRPRRSVRHCSRRPSSVRRLQR